MKDKNLNAKKKGKHIRKYCDLYVRERDEISGLETMTRDEILYYEFFAKYEGYYHPAFGKLPLGQSETVKSALHYFRESEVIPLEMKMQKNTDQFANKDEQLTQIKHPNIIKSEKRIKLE